MIEKLKLDIYPKDYNSFADMGNAQSIEYKINEIIEVVNRLESRTTASTPYCPCKPCVDWLTNHPL